MTGFVTRSPALEKVLGLARKVARARLPVLILGESGTGKGLLARQIHEWSDRQQRALVTVDCAAIPGELLESEMFGHVKGAFTGAVEDTPGRVREAEGGTLFLDGVTHLHAPIQAKLLRVLGEGVARQVGGSQSHPVDIRVVSAAGVDLEALEEGGALREDLYYRLKGALLSIPPLRDRPEDIGGLASGFLEEFCTRFQRRLGLSEEALTLLAAHRWPGNVRELRHTIERAVVVCEGREVGVDDLPPEIRPGGQQSARTGLGLQERVARYEASLIEQALQATGGNQVRAAKALGVKRSTLQYKMRKHGLS